MAITTLVEPAGLHVIDVGCGGGIYSEAWAEMGAHTVTGVDNSAVMVDAAREHAKGQSNVRFCIGDATATGLPNNTADIVFERALIHHLSDLKPCFDEAYRLLKPGGHFVIQDRTPEDISLPASACHIRGYLFEAFPRLLDVEMGRRRDVATVEKYMLGSGFQNIQTSTLWETRKVYASWHELKRDLEERTGRSILHELTDDELQSLISFMRPRLVSGEKVIERDRWTIWCGLKG